MPIEGAKPNISGFVAVFVICATTPLAAYERAECEQAGKAWLALRACSALLETPNLSKEDRAKFLIRRGHASITEDDAENAVSDFTQALEADPANVEALKGRAKASTLIGKHEAAAGDWAALAAKAPDAAGQEPLYVEQAKSLLAAGNTGAALAGFAKAIELNPKSIAGHIGRANAFAAMSDKDKALAEFDLAQKIDPADISTYVARAQAAEKWGDTKLAIENYTIAVKNNTRSAGPWRQALRRLGVDTVP